MTSPVTANKGYTHLHFYQCSWCKTTATSPVYDPSYPPKCGMCLRYMARLYSEPIETAEQRALADRGLVFNPYHQFGPIKRMCDTCKAPTVLSQMIDLGVGGKYCSAQCADEGTEKHRIAMEGVRERVAKLYEEKPWLKPAPLSTDK